MNDLSPLPIGPAVASRSSATTLRLLLLGVAAVGSVGFGFVFTPFGKAGDYIQSFGYYTIMLTYAWFVIAFSRVAGGIWRDLPPLVRRERWQTGGVIVACTVVAALTVPYSHKILYDEYVLQGTAWNMHFSREVGTMVRGFSVDGVFSPITTYLDKRPFFFAYLVSLLHDVTGYRITNAFALNTALMPTILALVYFYARRLVAHAAALAATLALGTFSLLAHNATGAGMEMLNLAMLLLTLHLAAHYLAAPDGARLSVLVLAVVLLAQTRYESSLYVGPVAVVVLEGWRRAGRLILPAAAVLGPVLLIPYALHYTYLSGMPMLWELREKDSTRFGLQYFYDNVGHAWHYFFDTSTLLTNSWWLFGAGLVGLAAVLLSLVRALPRWRTAGSASVALTLLGAGIVANLTLLQFYYWGQLDDPIASRLSLPFAVLLVLCLALALGRWPALRLPAWSRVPSWSLTTFAMGGAVVSMLASELVENARHTGLNVLGQEIAWEDHYIASLPPGDRLIVTNKSVLPWYEEHVASIQIERARGRMGQVKYHLDQHTFCEVLVLQTYRPIGPEGGFQIEPGDRLPAAYVLEPVIEHRFGGHIDRISRVTAIHWPILPSLPDAPSIPAKASDLVSNP